MRGESKARRATPRRAAAATPASAGARRRRRRRARRTSSTINAPPAARLTVPRKLFRKYLPQPEAVLARAWCAPFRPWLAHPSLWHLNRRSVAGAVAIGLFAGLIPGPFQMLGALLLAIPLRRNIPEIGRAHV